MASPRSQIFNDLARCQDPQDVRVEVAEEHGRSCGCARFAPLKIEGSRGAASGQAKHPRFVGVNGSAHNVAAAAELLERKETNRLFAEGSGITDFGRFKKVSRQVAEPVFGEAPTVVFNCDERSRTLAPEHDADSLASHVALGVLIGSIRDEFVQCIFRILVCLARNQHGLGQIPYSETHFLGWHPSDRTAAACLMY
jgi:hypothetical protein